MAEDFKLPVLARDRLRAELRKHPEITKHLAVDTVNGLAKGELLALADKLGIDVKAIIADVQKVPSAVGMEAFHEEEELERYNHSHKWPAFSGSADFDVTLEVFGLRIARKMRVEYRHTPAWEYFDLQKQAPYVGWDSTSWTLLMLTVPAEDADDDHQPAEDDDKPEWVKVGDLSQLGLLPRAFWDRLDEVIEANCKAEDAERRRLAAERRPTPPSVRPARKRPNGRRK